MITGGKKKILKEEEEGRAKVPGPQKQDTGRDTEQSTLVSDHFFLKLFKGAQQCLYPESRRE